jgi:hypothetical protein
MGLSFFFGVAKAFQFQHTAQMVAQGQVVVHDSRFDGDDIRISAGTSNRQLHSLIV